MVEEGQHLHRVRQDAGVQDSVAKRGHAGDLSGGRLHAVEAARSSPHRTTMQLREEPEKKRESDLEPKWRQVEHD
eukprot:3497575-Heterocapsa_arctica.AAC.1